MSDVAHSSKVSDDLASRIEASAADGLVDVVVELDAVSVEKTDSMDRQAAIAARKEGFQSAAAPVVETIVSCGGEVTGEAWINQTLRARVPAGSIQRIAAQATVTLVDVPHAIEPELG